MTKQGLKTEIENMATEMDITFVEACQAMQAAASQMGNEKMITEIHNLKMESLGM